MHKIAVYSTRLVLPSKVSNDGRRKLVKIGSFGMFYAKGDRFKVGLIRFSPLLEFLLHLI